MPANKPTYHILSLKIQPYSWSVTTTYILQFQQRKLRILRYLGELALSRVFSKLLTIQFSLTVTYWEMSALHMVMTYRNAANMAKSAYTVIILTKFRDGFQCPCTIPFRANLRENVLRSDCRTPGPL